MDEALAGAADEWWLVLPPMVRLVMERLRAASGRLLAKKLAVLLKNHADAEDEEAGAADMDVGEL